MATQRVTIELRTDPRTEATHWYLFGATGKPVADSTRYGDRMPFSSSEAAMISAAKAANTLLWMERGCV